MKKIFKILYTVFAVFITINIILMVYILNLHVTVNCEEVGSNCQTKEIYYQPQWYTDMFSEEYIFGDNSYIVESGSDIIVYSQYELIAKPNEDVIIGYDDEQEMLLIDNRYFSPSDEIYVLNNSGDKEKININKGDTYNSKENYLFLEYYVDEESDSNGEEGYFLLREYTPENIIGTSAINYY